MRMRCPRVWSWQVNTEYNSAQLLSTEFPHLLILSWGKASWSSRITWHQSPKADSFSFYQPQSGRPQSGLPGSRAHGSTHNASCFLIFLFSLAELPPSPKQSCKWKQLSTGQEFQRPKQKEKGVGVKWGEGGGQEVSWQLGLAQKLEAETDWRADGPEAAMGKAMPPGPPQALKQLLHFCTDSQILNNPREKYFYIFPSGLLVVTFLVPIIYSFILLNHARDENQLKLMLEFLIFISLLKSYWESRGLIVLEPGFKSL